MLRTGARALVALLALAGHSAASALPCGGSAASETAHAAAAAHHDGRPAAAHPGHAKAGHERAPLSVAAVCPCGCESGPSAASSAARLGFALAAAPPSRLAPAAPAQRAAPPGTAFRGHRPAPDHVPLSA